ncbi:MAG: hypothetical protein QOG75_2757 [Mycobacterium sp.]|nr:hypothetical protein [Mycobacterium sp.]
MRVTGSRDETWLRVLDVASALGGRTYAGEGTVTLRVKDPLLQEESQTFVISQHGAEPTDRAAQLEAGIEAVAAALLGATSWRSLALAGLARVNDSAALDVADRLFYVAESPHAGIYF